MKTAVIYSRVSSTSDRQSTERQVLDLISYADKNEFKVCKVFEEKISGAKKNEERTILMECINYCISQKIDTLLTGYSGQNDQSSPDEIDHPHKTEPELLFSSLIAVTNL